MLQKRILILLTITFFLRTKEVVKANPQLVQQSSHYHYKQKRESNFFKKLPEKRKKKRKSKIIYFFIFAFVLFGLIIIFPMRYFNMPYFKSAKESAKERYYINLTQKIVSKTMLLPNKKEEKLINKFPYRKYNVSPEDILKAERMKVREEAVWVLRICWEMSEDFKSDLLTYNEAYFDEWYTLEEQLINLIFHQKRDNEKLNKKLNKKLNEKLKEEIKKMSWKELVSNERYYDRLLKYLSLKINELETNPTDSQADSQENNTKARFDKTIKFSQEQAKNYFHFTKHGTTHGIVAKNDKNKDQIDKIINKHNKEKNNYLCGCCFDDIEEVDNIMYVQCPHKTDKPHMAGCLNCLKNMTPKKEMIDNEPHYYYHCLHCIKELDENFYGALLGLT